MKTIAITILTRLLDRYGVWALSYLLTKLLAFLFERSNKNTNLVISETEDIIEALQYIITSAKDGIITEEEIKQAIPIMKEALSFK